MQLKAIGLSYRLHSPHPKPQQGHLIPPLDGLEVKSHCTIRDHSHFFPFSWLSIADQETVSRSAALLRIKALALQKRPLFLLFALAGKPAAILDVIMLCPVEGAQCKTRQLP